MSETLTDYLDEQAYIMAQDMAQDMTRKNLVRAEIFSAIAAAKKFGASDEGIIQHLMETIDGLTLDEAQQSVSSYESGELQRVQV